MFQNRRLLVGCVTSLQHVSVSQGWICTDNFTYNHTKDSNPGSSTLEADALATRPTLLARLCIGKKGNLSGKSREKIRHLTPTAWKIKSFPKRGKSWLKTDGSGRANNARLGSSPVS